MSNRKLVTVLAGGLLLAGWCGLASAQENRSTPPADAPRESRGGSRDPGEWRQRMADMMKQQLGVSDEEWKALQPKIEKVATLSMQSRMGGMFGRRSSREGQAETPVSQASHALRQALEDKNTSAEVIAQKLTALREAREKAKVELAAAQKDLKELLTQRQEATLIMMGILE